MALASLLVASANAQLADPFSGIVPVPAPSPVVWSTNATVVVRPDPDTQKLLNDLSNEAFISWDTVVGGLLAIVGGFLAELAMSARQKKQQDTD